MATLKSCLGIHNAPPALANAIRKKMQEYKDDGYDSQSAVEQALKEVQGTLRQELNSVHEQIKAQRPDVIKQAEDAALTADEQQIADLMAAQVTAINDKTFQLRNADPNKIIDNLNAITKGQLTTEEITQIVGTVNDVGIADRRLMALFAKNTSEGIQQITHEYKQMGLESAKVPTEEQWRSMSDDQRKVEMMKLELLKALERKRNDIQVKYQHEIAVVKVSKAVQDLAQATGRNNTQSVIDLLAGRATGNVQSVLAKTEAISDELLAPLYKEFAKYDGILGFKFNDKLQGDFVSEIYGIDTQNSAAKKLVDVWQKTQDIVLKRMNQQGIKVGRLENRIVGQQWDDAKVRTFGVENAARRIVMGEGGTVKLEARSNWVDYMMQDGVIDRQNSTYIDPITGKYWGDARMREFLTAAWESMAGMKDAEATGGIPGGGLRGRMEKERQIHFASGQAWLDANKIFGSVDLFDAMVAQTNRTARDLALLETFGPRADAAFETVLSKSINEDKYKNYYHKKSESTAKGLWMELTGSRPIDGYGLLSESASTMRTMLVPIRLASSILAQVSDSVTFAAWAMKHDMGMMNGIRSIIAGYNPRSGAHRATADIDSFGMETLNDSISMRLFDNTNKDNAVSKYANAVMAISGTRYHQNSFIYAAKMSVARAVSVYSGKAYNNLPAGFKQTLKRNGIDSAAWDVLRTSDMAEAHGRDILTPELVQDQNARELYRGMLNFESRMAVIRPDELSKAFMRGTSASNTLLYEAANSFWQFRTFTLAYFQRVIPMVMAKYEGETQASRIGVMMTLAIGSAIAGYMSQSLKDIAFGKEPPLIDKPETWVKSFANTMGFGFFASFLFNNKRDIERQFTSELLGALPGEIVKAAMVGKDVADLAGDDPDKVEQSKRYLVQYLRQHSLPNFWFAKLAADQYLWYPLMDYVNPGYTDRLQRTLEGKGTSFWMPPTGSK